jgi:hypothetical protein
MTLTRHFPNSTACLVHQTGTVLTTPSNGVSITLHWREGEAPCSAELVSGDHYADIGLEFEGKRLVGYDGVFACPLEVLTMLQDAGYDVSEITP